MCSILYYLLNNKTAYQQQSARKRNLKPKRDGDQSFGIKFKNKTRLCPNIPLTTRNENHQKKKDRVKTALTFLRRSKTRKCRNYLDVATGLDSTNDERQECGSQKVVYLHSEIGVPEIKVQWNHQSEQLATQINGNEIGDTTEERMGGNPIGGISAQMLLASVPNSTPLC